MANHNPPGTLLNKARLERARLISEESTSKGALILKLVLAHMSHRARPRSKVWGKGVMEILDRHEPLNGILPFSLPLSSFLFQSPPAIRFE